MSDIEKLKDMLEKVVAETIAMRDDWSDKINEIHTIQELQSRLHSITA